MAGGPFYLLDAAATGSAHGKLQDGGSAPGASTSGTGWDESQANGADYAKLVYAGALTVGWSASVLPASPLTTTDCWRTDATLSGDFASGNWTIAISAISQGQTTVGPSNIGVRVYRGTNATGTGATQITSAIQALGNFANLLTTVAQNTTVTWNAPAITLASEYLFFQLALHCTTKEVTQNNQGPRIRVDGTNSKITPTTFTPVAAGVAYRIVGFPPDEGRLPPGVAVLAGAGDLPAIWAVTRSQPFSVDLPPQDSLAAGAGNLPAIWALARSTGFYASLPPQDGIAPGAGDAPAVWSLKRSTGFPADLPPKDTLAPGFGQAAQVAALARATETRDAVLKPPQGAIAQGFGSLPAIAQLFRAVTAVEAVLGPPPQILSAGFGDAAQVAAIARAVVALEAMLGPPTCTLFAGVPPPPPATSGTIFSAPPITAADLPPLYAIAAGAGSLPQIAATSRAVVVVDVTTTPPTVVVLAGVQPPPPPTSGSVLRAAQADTALLPPLDTVAAGFGLLSQIAATSRATVVVDVTTAPPTVSVLAGVAPPPPPSSGTVFSAPPVTAAILPPLDAVIAGFGVPSAVAWTSRAIPVVDVTATPPTASLLAGVAPPPLPTSGTIFSAPPITAALLPPLDAVVAGFGVPPAIARTSRAVVVVDVVSLPATISLLAGVSPPPLPAFAAVSARPSPEALLPPPRAVSAGAGQPAQTWAIVRPTFAIEPAAAPPAPFDVVARGAGSLPQVAVLTRATILPEVVVIGPPSPRVLVGFGIVVIIDIGISHFPTYTTGVVPTIAAIAALTSTTTSVVLTAFPTVATPLVIDSPHI